MKTTQIIVLTALFFSAITPSVMQAVTLSDWGCIVWHLAWKYQETVEKRWNYHQLKKEANYWKGELLAKVDTNKIVVDSHGGQNRLVSLKPEEIREVHEAFELLEIPKFLAKKILVLGVESVKQAKRRIAGLTCGVGYNGFYYIPYAVLFDAKYLATLSPLVKKIALLHEGGHVVSNCAGVCRGNKELLEVTADTFALAALTRQINKDQLWNLTLSPGPNRPKPHFNQQELFYYGKKMLTCKQKKVNRSDVLSFARKIITDRKKNGYEEKIAQGTIDLLWPYTSENHLSRDGKECNPLSKL